MSYIGAFIHVPACLLRIRLSANALGKQSRKGSSTCTLPPMWENWMKPQAPAFDLAQPWVIAVICGVNQGMEDPFVSLSLSPLLFVNPPFK